MYHENSELEKEIDRLRALLEDSKQSAEAEKSQNQEETARLMADIAAKAETIKGQNDHLRILEKERDNQILRVREVEDRLRDKEDMLDKLRKEYNELMEKHLKTPTKVTTVTTTVEHDPNMMELPERDESKGVPRNRMIQSDAEVDEQSVQVGDSSKLDQPRKEDLARIAELQEEVRSKD